MRTSQPGLEARLRGDLPRLANTLLDGPTGNDELFAPTARSRRRSMRPAGWKVAAAVFVVLIVGLGVVVVMMRGDGAQPRSRAATSEMTIGDVVALPEPPLSARSSPVLAWTGRSLIVWGGLQGDPNAVPFALLDGVAYDPDSAWTRITRNQWGHPGAVGTSANGRLVVLAKTGGGEYLPDTNRWRDLPRLPGTTGGFVAIAASNGSVFGLVAPFTGDDSLEIARLDAPADHWQMLAGTTKGATASSFDLIERNGGLDLWADGRRVARYDIERNTWESGDGLTVPDGCSARR